MERKKISSFEWDQTAQIALRTTYQKQKRHNDVLPNVSDAVDDSAVQQQVKLRRPARVVIISGKKWWQRRVRDMKMNVKTFNSENGSPTDKAYQSHHFGGTVPSGTFCQCFSCGTCAPSRASFCTPLLALFAENDDDRFPHDRFGCNRRPI